MRSPRFKTVQSKCVSLRFLINGHNDVNLRVYVKALNGTVFSSAHWTHTQNKWRRGYLKVMDDEIFYVFITATMRPKSNTQAQRDIVAIDAIRLEKCVHGMLESNCNG